MEFYSIADVAEMSKQSQKTVRRNIAAGKIKADKVSNRYRISKDNYEKWLISDHNAEEDNIFKGTAVKEQTGDIVNWIDISDKWAYDGWANSNYKNGYNFIDLFSGAGGLSCGLTMAGFTPVGSVEIMPEAVQTYWHNFVENKGFSETVETRDIREARVKKALYDSMKDKHIHLVVGGFPCQGFSMAGNRVVTDPRNSLYLEMLEIVKHIKPDFVVMENVEGLRSMLNGKVEAKIINDYKEAGYEINVTVLNSADYGVPQIRRRVIFIGNRHRVKNFHPKPLYAPDYYVTLGECIKKYMFMPENKQINHIFTKHSAKMIEQIKALPEGESLYGNYSDAWKKSPWDKPSCTVKENHGGVNIHPKLPRVLTPRELAALQSFPDDFIFQGSKKWQLVQIGNAVPPILGKAIGIAVMKGLNQIYE
jgi:DNA (cytosine-5)-methyltransferase 1